MSNRKRTVSTIAVITALVLAGGWVFAHGPSGGRGDWHPGPGYGYYSDLSPEQQEKLEAQEQKFYEDTAELRRELYQKRLELQGLWIDPKADPEKIKANQKEVFDLHQKLQEKALEHRLATRELLPEGYSGRGPTGYGHHMGYGPMHGGGHMWGHGFGAKRGYGGGYCW